MKLDRRFVASLFFVTVALVCMACAPKGGRVGAANGSQNRSNIASPVAAPLSVKVPNPARLTSISALRILPPTISSSVTDSSITVKGLQEIVEARADEALTMKVVPAAGAAKTDAVLKTEIDRSFSVSSCDRFKALSRNLNSRIQLNCVHCLSLNRFLKTFEAPFSKSHCVSHLC
mgnify:CR=1 FL=1